MATLAFTSEQTMIMLDRVHLKTGKLPTYGECQKIGYKGGSARFNVIRKGWAQDRSVPLRPCQREVETYVPPDLKAEAEKHKFTSPHSKPKPEAERSAKKARPISTPFDLMTPAQQAVQLYRSSWKRIREAGA